MGWLLTLLTSLDNDPFDRAHAIWSTNPLLIERDERYTVLGETILPAAVTAARAVDRRGVRADLVPRSVRRDRVANSGCADANR